MNTDVVPVQVLAALPTEQDLTAIFVGTEEKCFVIHVEQGVGRVVSMAMRGDKAERPLTHDLIGLVFNALDVKVERVVINELSESTYYARLILKVHNEIHKKIVEIDARPSDSIVIALQSKAPIYVSNDVWSEVEDMTEVLEAMKKALREKKSKTDLGDLF